MIVIAIIFGAMLSASLIFGGLVGFSCASVWLGRRADPFCMANHRAWIGAPGFAIVILSAPSGAPALFAINVLPIGLGERLISHDTLTVTTSLSPRQQVGLALGALGAVQATSAGIAIALGRGMLRDVLSGAVGPQSSALVYSVIHPPEIVPPLLQSRQALRIAANQGGMLVR